MSQKKSRIGAIGEHMAAAQLMLQGFDAVNANLSINNMEGIDLICINEKGESALVQVKTTEKKGGFPVGMSIKNVLDKKYVEDHVHGPWIFVRVLGQYPNQTFKYFVLSRKQVIDLIYESNDWYVNQLTHKNANLSLDAACVIQEEWLNGTDCPSKQLSGPDFKNPLKGEYTEDRWDNIWK